jgi:hypothetical protein
MSKHLKEFLIGSGIGLTCPMIALFVYWLFTWTNMSFIPGFFNFLYDHHQIGSHLSLACVVNLPIFYILLNKDRLKFAQGVIFGTLVYAFYIFYYKLFVSAD